MNQMHVCVDCIADSIVYARKNNPNAWVYHLNMNDYCDPTKPVADNSGMCERCNSDTSDIHTVCIESKN